MMITTERAIKILGEAARGRVSVSKDFQEACAIGKRAVKLTARALSGDGMLTITEAAWLVNVHQSTIRRWCAMGLVRAYRIGPRGDRRFKREDVATLLREKELLGAP